MRGLILLSVLIGNLLIPIAGARQPTVRASVRKTIFMMIGFNLMCAAALRYWYWLV